MIVCREKFMNGIDKNHTPGMLDEWEYLIRSVWSFHMRVFTELTHHLIGF